MKIALGADHAGFNYKDSIVSWLKNNNYEPVDFGTYSEESADYPDFAFSAAKAVSSGEADFGILICGTGIGVSITANKVNGIRAANCCTPEMAKLAREHNNANILAFGARLITLDTAMKITETFLAGEFQGGRHLRRVEKIHALTGC